MSEINILVSCNSKYCKYLEVLLISIFENHKNYVVNIHLIHRELTNENLAGLRSISRQYSQELFVYYISAEHYHDMVLNDQYFSIEAYFRLMAHELLPDYLDRVLWLDTDIVVDKDIYSLYNMDFENNYLIACSNYARQPSRVDAKCVDLKTAAKGGYFNSGVLLMNLKKFRDNVSIDTYKQAIIKLGEDYFQDQGLLNYLFVTQTIIIQTLEYNFRYAQYMKYMQEVNDGKPEIDFSPRIYHYPCTLFKYKPWDLYFNDDELNIVSHDLIAPPGQAFEINKTLNDINGVWWKYAKSSFHYDLLLSEMEAKKEWYIRLLHSYVKRHYALYNSVEYYKEKCQGEKK